MFSQFPKYIHLVIYKHLYQKIVIRNGAGGGLVAVELQLGGRRHRRHVAANRRTCDVYYLLY